MKLTIIRHGATENNLQARYTGQSDIPLSDLGFAQATAASERLAQTQWTALISSDLRRAQQTAQAINRRHGLPVLLDPDLREISMGAWEGHTYAEIQQTDATHLAEWQADPLRVAPPGGETVERFAQRINRAFERWRTRYSSSSDTVIWVTHGGVLGVLLCSVLGLDLSHRWQFRRDNAALTTLDVGKDYVIVMTVNDTCHLSSLMLDEGGEKAQVL